MYNSIQSHFKFELFDIVYIKHFHLKVIRPRKIRPQAKIDNFAFKNSISFIKGII